MNNEEQNKNETQEISTTEKDEITNENQQGTPKTKKIDLSMEESTFELPGNSNTTQLTTKEDSSPTTTTQKNLNESNTTLKPIQNAPQGASNRNVEVKPSVTLSHPSLLNDQNSIAGVKRDRSAADFTLMMDHFTPIIPDAAINYYLTRSGFDCEDRRVKRLLALATQKFMYDICNNAFQGNKLRTQNVREKKKAKKTHLTMEDLSAALADYGINVNKPDYHI